MGAKTTSSTEAGGTKQVPVIARPKPPAAGKGRPKGSLNKTTTALKDMILTALDKAHTDGGIGYLTQQAQQNPAAFMTLVGKVLPMQVTGSGEDGAIVHRIELIGVAPR